MVGASHQYTNNSKTVRLYFVSATTGHSTFGIIPALDCTPPRRVGLKRMLCDNRRTQRFDEYYQKMASSDAHIMAIGMFVIKLLGQYLNNHL